MEKTNKFRLGQTVYVKIGGKVEKAVVQVIKQPSMYSKEKPTYLLKGAVISGGEFFEKHLYSTAFACRAMSK